MRVWRRGGFTEDAERELVRGAKPADPTRVRPWRRPLVQALRDLPLEDLVRVCDALREAEDPTQGLMGLVKLRPAVTPPG